jgi:Ca2+-binding EF-hand superfamily protein
MKRLAVMLTAGVCLVSARAGAEPKPRKPVALAKAALPPLPDEENRTYAELLRAADANGDSRVSAGELERFVLRGVQEQVTLRFRRLDRNADGKVALREVPTMAPDRFRRFDVNGDGGFTAAELSKILLEQAAARCRTALARLDHDGDGTLSAADCATPVRVAKR